MVHIEIVYCCRLGKMELSKPFLKDIVFNNGTAGDFWKENFNYVKTLDTTKRDSKIILFRSKHFKAQNYRHIRCERNEYVDVNHVPIYEVEITQKLKHEDPVKYEYDLKSITEATQL